MIFYLKLLYLAIKRKNSRDDYFEFQEFMSTKVIKNFIRSAGINNTKNKTIVDYGCGEGAYSLNLAQFFKKTIAIDEFINLKTNERLNKIKKIKLVKTNLLGYKGIPVDAIFCASVVEHMPKEKLPLFFRSLNLNLKNDGILYLSFPPFLSPIGGHHTAPFHYLPDKIAFLLTYLIKGKKISSYENMFGNWGLYKTNIRSIKKYLELNDFKIIKIQSRFMPSIFNIFFAKNNFFNWHCEIICQKKSLGPIRIKN